jgi:hypothetical protein
MKTIIFLLIIAAGFFYIRGAKAILEKDKEIKCEWNLIVVVCEGKKPDFPNFMEAVKEGIKF